MWTFYSESCLVPRVVLNHRFPDCFTVTSATIHRFRGFLFTNSFHNSLCKVWPLSKGIMVERNKQSRKKNGSCGIDVINSWKEIG